MEADNTVLLQVYSLPGLEPLLGHALEASLGFPWAWAPDEAAQLPRVLRGRPRWPARSGEKRFPAQRSVLAWQLP